MFEYLFNFNILSKSCFAVVYIIILHTDPFLELGLPVLLISFLNLGVYFNKIYRNTDKNHEKFFITLEKYRTS